jgi:hypothetical protein
VSGRGIESGPVGGVLRSGRLEDNPFGCVTLSGIRARVVVWSTRASCAGSRWMCPAARRVRSARRFANPPSCVVFDPLDGSSNIDAGVNVGTIFGVYKVVSGPRTSWIRSAPSFAARAVRATADSESEGGIERRY